MTLIEKKTICENPLSPFCYFGWPSVTRLPGGELAMTASGYRMRHVCPFGKAVISYSRDEGKSWTRPAPVIDTPLDDRDSGIVSFANGRVIMTSFNNSIAMQRNWSTWLATETPLQKAQKAFTDAYLDMLTNLPGGEDLLGSTYALSEDGGYSFGPVRISPVTNPHGPMPTKDGGLLYIGRHFCTDNSLDDGKTPFLECARLNERDEFEVISTIPNVPNPYTGKGVLGSYEPHAIELPSGKILVHIRMEGDCFTVYQSESTDGGKSFTAPHPLLSRYGGSPAHLVLLPDGRVISVYGYRSEPFGLRYMISEDEGETWTTDLVLDDSCANSDLGYPCSVLLRDGNLLTVYYQNMGDTTVIRQIIWKP